MGGSHSSVAQVVEEKDAGRSGQSKAGELGQSVPARVWGKRGVTSVSRPCGLGGAWAFSGLEQGELIGRFGHLSWLQAWGLVQALGRTSVLVGQVSLLVFKWKKLMTDGSRTGVSAPPRSPPLPSSLVCPALAAQQSTHEIPNQLTLFTLLYVCAFMYRLPSILIDIILFIKLLKNILSALYYLCFKNRLHHCILHDEVNQTRPLLVYVLRCFSPVATYT